MILALKGASAGDEVAAAEEQLAAAQLVAEILTVQAHPAVAPATVVRVRDRERPG